MSVELPEEIRRFIESFPSGCWALTSQGQTAIIVKVATEEVHSLWRIPIEASFKFCPFPGVTGVCLVLTMTKPDGSGLSFENLWDVAQANEKRDVKRLATQKYFDLYFFDGETKYTFTRRVSLNAEHRKALAQAVGEGLAYLKGIYQRAKDSAKVRAHFIIDKDAD